MMKYLSVLFLLFVMTLTSCATAPKPEEIQTAVQSTARAKSRGSFPFLGEKLTFDARHVATKAVVANAWLNVGHVQTKDGVKYIPITGAANSVAFARLLAKVDDEVQVMIDPDTWESTYSKKHLDDTGRDRTFEVWFWPEESTASVERLYKEKVSARDYELPQGTVDSIEWVYIARMTEFEPDKKYTWFTFDGWTLNRVTVVMEGYEDVWTELGFFKCKKLKLYRERSEAVTPQGALSGIFIEPPRSIHREEYELATAWISDDDNRLPARFVVTTAIGDFDLLLKSATKE